MLILSFASLIVDLSPQFLHCSICLCVLYFYRLTFLYLFTLTTTVSITIEKWPKENDMIEKRQWAVEKTEKQWLISLFCTFTDIIRGPDTLNSNHVGSVSNPSHLFSSHCDSHFCTITNCTYFLFFFYKWTCFHPVQSGESTTVSN